MNDVIPFRFESANVRALTIDGEPWFVASDIAEVLGYGHTPHMIRMLEEDEKGVHNVDTLGGAQKMTIINESGLYSAILRSSKPEAKAFRKWVTGAVLPCLRKTGRYEMGGSKAPSPQPDLFANSDKISNLLARIRAEPVAEVRQIMHGELATVFHQRGTPVPALADIEATAPKLASYRKRTDVPVAAEQFFRAVAQIEAGKYHVNHSRDPGRLAYSLPQVRMVAETAKVRLPAGRRELRIALHSHPRFVGVIPVNSALSGRTVKCWVFAHDSIPSRRHAH